jgi:hypothetical protein
MDIRYDGNPEWKFLKDGKEDRGISEYKRTLVCKHPLERDSSQRMRACRRRSVSTFSLPIGPARF